MDNSRNTEFYKIWNRIADSDTAPDASEQLSAQRVLSSIEKGIRRRRALRTAARCSFCVVCAALLVTAGYFIGYHPAQDVVSMQSYYLAVADAGEQQLPDGSSVFLAAGSRLSYDSSFMTSREVHLEGDANFDVRHTVDDAPFLVHLPSGLIKVTGTRFSVRQDAESRLNIVLFEGKVSFTSTDGKLGYELEPGQQISFDPGQGTLNTSSFFPHVKWQENHYKLDNIPFDELVDFLEWKYDVSIRTKGMNDCRARVNGIVGLDESLESALNKITYSLKLRSGKVDDYYIVYK